MAKRDTIKALERRGLSSSLAERLTEAGFNLSNLKKVGYDQLNDLLTNNEIRLVIDSVGIKTIDRDMVLEAALAEDAATPKVPTTSAEAALKAVQKRVAIIWSLPEGASPEMLEEYLKENEAMVVGVTFPVNAKQFRFPLNSYIFEKAINGVRYRCTLTEIDSHDLPQVTDSPQMAHPEWSEELYTTYFYLRELAALPRNVDLEEFRKLNGTPVKSARNYTQIEDSFDWDREARRLEKEKLTTLKDFAKLGFSDKVTTKLFETGVNNLALLAAAPVEELTTLGVKADEAPQIQKKAAQMVARRQAKRATSAP